MNVAYAIPCRGIRQLPNRAHSLHDVPADIITVPSTPTTVNITLYTMLHGTELDAGVGSQHTVRITIRGTHHDIVGTELSTTISLLQEPTLGPAGWATTCALPLYIPIDVERPGTYRIEITVDNEPPHSVPILITTASTASPVSAINAPSV